MLEMKNTIKCLEEEMTIVTRLNLQIQLVQEALDDATCPVERERLTKKLEDLKFNLLKYIEDE